MNLVGSQHGGCGHQQAGASLPVNVAHVEDLAVCATNDGVAAGKLDGNRGPADVGGHGEVGDGGDEGDGSGDVVEDALLTRLRPGEAEEAHGGEGHQGANGPVDIRTVRGDGDLSRSTGIVDGATICRLMMSQLGAKDMTERLGRRADVQFVAMALFALFSRDMMMGSEAKDGWS